MAKRVPILASLLVLLPALPVAAEGIAAGEFQAACTRSIKGMDAKTCQCLAEELTRGTDALDDKAQLYAISLITDNGLRLKSIGGSLDDKAAETVAGVLKEKISTCAKQ